MKQHYCKYIIILTMLTFVSCEEMFMREITIDTMNEQEMLVLDAIFDTNDGYSLCMYHSLLITKEDVVKASDTWVTDAEVKIRINDKWYNLSNHFNMQYYSDEVPKIQPFDEIEVVATHPNYTSICAKQKIPQKVSAKIDSCKILENNWLDISLTMGAYEGNEDDMIAISLSYGILSISQYSFQLSKLYSTDKIFAEAQNLETSGYYGALGNRNNHYLYFSAKELEQPRTIHLIADRYWTDKDKKYPNPNKYNITLKVGSVTKEEYEYNLFLRRYWGVDYISPPTGVADENEYEEDNFMSEMLEDLAYMLNGEELVQIYTNVEGGAGYLFGRSTTTVQSNN